MLWLLALAPCSSILLWLPCSGILLRLGCHLGATWGRYAVMKKVDCIEVVFKEGLVKGRIDYYSSTVQASR